MIVMLALVDTRSSKTVHYHIHRLARPRETLCPTSRSTAYQTESNQYLIQRKKCQQKCIHILPLRFDSIKLLELISAKALVVFPFPANVFLARSSAKSFQFGGRKLAR